MRPQPLICVRDVEASSRWYQRLLGCRSDHGGPNYERLVHSGRLVFGLSALGFAAYGQLTAWSDHDWPRFIFATWFSGLSRRAFSYCCFAFA